MPDDPTAPADLVLLGARCAPWSRRAPRRCARGPRRRIVAVGNDEDVRGHIGLADARRGTRRTDRHTRVPGRPHPPDGGRARGAPLQPPRPPRSRHLPRGHRRLRGEPSRPGVDHGRRLGAGRLSWGTPRAEDLDRSSGPAGLPPEQGRARGLGEHARPRARRHHGGDPRPRRRPDRARPGRHADGNPARGCRGARGTAHPARYRRGPARRAEHAQRELHSRDHGVAGRLGAAADDRGLSPLRGAGPADCARRRRPLVGASAWPRADRGVARPQGARLVRPLPGHERQAVARRDRRELHRRDARPTWTAPGHQLPTAASTSSTPRSWPMP